MSTRTFNLTGPCDPERHYMLPALDRLPQAERLARAGEYFVLHAPRQSGKTTTLRQLARALNESGGYAAVVVSCQSAGAAGDDLDLTERKILSNLWASAARMLPEDLRPGAWPDVPADLVFTALQSWASGCPRPVVVLLDEVDALTGAGLANLLGQLRTGFADRPSEFPHAVVLCSMRDLQELEMAAGSGHPDVLGRASPFNASAGSFTLRNFTLDDVAALYAQHTADSGQEFTEGGVGFVHEQTGGQPWLVNALASWAIGGPAAAPHTKPIDECRLEWAKEQSIRQRSPHFTSLSARLEEPRVRRIVEPLLGDPDRSNELVAAASFGGDDHHTFRDDLSLVRDLGLVARDQPLRIANPIYGELMPRMLGDRLAPLMNTETADYIKADGSLDFDKLMQGFVEFWLVYGAMLTTSGEQREATHQLVLMAYLFNLVNGGGYVSREFAVGTGRGDLLVRWPHRTAGGERQLQHEIVEVEMRTAKSGDPVAAALSQLDDYCARYDVDHGTLVVFDKRPDASPIDQRTTIEGVTSPGRRAITLIRA